MKKFLAFLLCAATLVGFASCSDDEDDEGENVIDDPAALVGYWQAVEYRLESEGEVTVDDETEYEIVFHFDGTNCTVYELGDQASYCPYYYDTASHTLQFSGHVGAYFGLSAQVEKLTTKKLVLINAGYERLTVTFKKISSL